MNLCTSEIRFAQRPARSRLRLSLPGAALLAGALALAGCSDLLGTDDFAAVEDGPGQGLDDSDPPVDTGDEGPPMQCGPAEVPGAHDWSRSVGSKAADQAAATAVDHEGNIVIVGSVGGDVDFGGGVLAGAGGQDVFVAKLNPDGDHLWSLLLGDSSHQRAHDVTVDSAGNVFVVGSFEGTLTAEPERLDAKDQSGFVCKLAAEGGVSWCRRLGEEGSQSAASVAISPIDDSVWVTGEADGKVDVGGMSAASVEATGAFVVGLDSEGAPILVSILSGSVSAFGRAIAVDGGGNAIVVGQFEGTLGDLTAEGSDGFIAKIQPDGASAWLRRIGGAEAQAATAVAVDSEDQVLVGGSSDAPAIDVPGTAKTLQAEGAPAGFALSLDGDGEFRWAQPIAGDGAAGINAIVAHDDGRTTVAGWFDGTMSSPGGGHGLAEGVNAFLASYGGNGDEAWFMVMGTADDTFGADVSVDGCGAIVSVSNFSGSTKVVGGALLGGTGDTDWMIAKFQPN